MRVVDVVPDPSLSRGATTSALTFLAPVGAHSTAAVWQRDGDGGLAAEARIGRAVTRLVDLVLHGDAGGQAVALDGLTRRFGATTALEGLTFSVPEGSLSGFVGRNGAGKTTAMRIVLGVLAPDAGEVRWRGAPVGREDGRRFGYRPEERGLYPRMRVLDQLVHLAQLHGLTAGQARRSAQELLDRLGVADRAHDRTEALSLGNQQRVQLAAALVHDPELLVLDEPFSGLDPVGVDVLAEVLLERVRAGVAVLFSSHQLELVERLCDRVAIVDDGRLVASGPVRELRRERAGQRWVVELEGAPAEVHELATGDDSQALLDAARARGRVRRFAPLEPTLAELFRDAVEERATA